MEQIETEILRRLPNFSTISSIYIPHILNDHRKYRNQLEYFINRFYDKHITISSDK